MTFKANSFDIAQKVGVAQSTVSRALRGDKCVSEATRERIRAAAAELNYVVDRNASNMRLKTTFTLALVVIYRAEATIASVSSFHHMLIGCIAEAAAERGYNILISFQNDAENLFGRYQDSRMADGLIVIGTTLNRAAWDYFKSVAADDRAITSWCAPERGLDSIMCDNAAGVRLATEHLIAGGCKNIVFIGPAEHGEMQFDERHDAFAEVMAQHSLRPVTAPAISAMSREQVGYDSVTALLQADTAFDGVFAANDAIGIGALRALRDHNIRVPEDVSVVGFDAIPAGSSYNPSITSIEPDYHQAGKLLVQSVCAQIAGTENINDRVGVKLVVRESSRGAMR